MNNSKYANSFLEFNETTNEYKNLCCSLREIYRVFSFYKKPPSNLTCLDYGPTQDERQIFDDNRLSSLPNDFIDKLEFYDETWSSWGTEQEVKYFIPRLFDRLAMYLKIKNQHFISHQSITYKLGNSENWKPAEQIAIRSFFMNYFKYFITQNNFVLMDDIFNLIFSVENNLSSYVNILETAPPLIKEKSFQAVFEGWIDPSIANMFSMKYDLHFTEEKKLIIDRILNNEALMLSLEFLYKSPWLEIIFTRKKS